MPATVRNDKPILDIDQINVLSPYPVIYDDDEGAFIFPANNGLNCSISFSRDEGVLGDVEEVYHLVVTTRPAVVAHTDSGIQQAIIAILSVFFHDNRRIILYQCDHRNTFEGRHETPFPYQTLRARRFNIWYVQANRDGQYEKLDAEIDRGGTPNHISVICRSDCPGRKKLLKEFDRLVTYLTSDDEK
jgi:hypothetical protein